MKYKPNKYQYDCLNRVTDCILKGVRHISVVSIAGAGKKTTSLFLAQKLVAKEPIKIALVFKYKAILLQARSIAEEFGDISADYYTVKDFLNCNTDYKYVFLYDLSVIERKQIKASSLIKDSITISFFDPCQETHEAIDNLNANRDFYTYIEEASPVVCVYITKKTIDIRDAKYSGETERAYVYKENSGLKIWLQDKKNQTVNERAEIEKQAEEIERINTLSLTNDRDRKTEELKTREADCQKQLKIKDTEIEQLQLMISYMQSLLADFGIDKETLAESFAYIRSVRDSLKKDFESGNEDVKERAQKQLQDAIAEMISSTLNKSAFKMDMNYYKECLIGNLTEDVWNKLDDNSKTYLITAKSTYECMINMASADTYDYSGVCLLVTKALEVEVAKRFFYSYKAYLKQEYPSVSDWPYCLRQRDHGQITDKVIDDEEFTLGSVVSVIGRYRIYDEDGHIKQFGIKNDKESDMFLRYAQKCLYKSSDKSKVLEELKRDYQFIEKVRLKYRNPAAHRDGLTKVSAQKCLEYVIEIQCMLRKMLGSMKM